MNDRRHERQAAARGLCAHVPARAGRSPAIAAADSCCASDRGPTEICEVSTASGSGVPGIRARRSVAGAGRVRLRCTVTCADASTLSRSLEARRDGRRSAGAAGRSGRRHARLRADSRPRAHLLGSRRRRRHTKKLDAIDTDQITPAADCVSESLETLDEKWKAGSFRYLMPDFRARVHRGQTFLVAGDRFAIGSSREMSPAGLKGVAEEVGLEMVVICGHNMGDIFRRNAFNLGLHVVQCPEAVADARDDDEFTFDPVSRAIANVTQGKTYTPVPLSAKEEEIRRSGGIFAVGRREFTASVETPPSLDWPDAALARRHDDDRADRLGAPRRQATCRARISSRARRCASTRTCCRPPTARRRSRFTRSTRSPAARRSFRARRRSPTTTSCSPARTRTTSRRRSAARSRPRTAWRSRTTRRRATASSISTFPSRASCCPASSFPGADSHSRAYGAYGAVGIGVGSTTLGIRLVDRLHLLHAREGAPRGVHRAPQSVGRRQGHRARAAAPLGREAVAGHVGRVRRSRPAVADGLAQHHRQHDGGGRGAERHLRARRADARVVPREGHDGLAVSDGAARRQRASTRSTRRST